ncbi:MAG: T9SS type A sorting domain-containing protein [Flavobacteriales bacterium]
MKVLIFTLLAIIGKMSDISAQVIFEFQHSQAPELRITPYSDQAILINQSITLNQNPAATGGTAPYTFSWSPSAGLDNSTIPNPVASPSTSTTYTFQVTDSKGCTASRQITIIVESPLNTADANANQAMLYPNPTKDQCVLRWPNQGKVQIEITDINGRMLEKQNQLNNQQEDIRVDLSTFEPGIYFINAFDEQLKMQFKIILQ